MTYTTARLKQTAEQIIISPLVFLGFVIGFFYRKPNPGGYFLIYPNRDRGGSYKVNADIEALIQDRQPLVIFTKHELNGGFRHLFDLPGVNILDISAQIDNKYYHFLNVIWRGIIASWINRCPNPVMLGGECIYFFKLLPHVKKQTLCIESCHVNKWLNYTQAFVPFINHRIFSTQKIKRDVEQQYELNKVPAHFLERLLFIDNKVHVPEEYWPENDSLQVLFIGRGNPQKRVHLVAEIARQVKQIEPKIGFTLVGDVAELVPDEVKEMVTIRTDVNRAEQLKGLYRHHDVLILTSLFEGLPIVVMDMMAQGRAVISTAIDGVPDNIQHYYNGLLIGDILNEAFVISEGVKFILELNADRKLLRVLSENARTFAIDHFSSAVFDQSFNKVLGIQNGKP